MLILLREVSHTNNLAKVMRFIVGFLSSIRLGLLLELHLNLYKRENVMEERF